MFHVSSKDREIEDRVDWALEIMGLNDVSDAMPTDLAMGVESLLALQEH
ncbi:MAG: hypothetical protein CM15mP49_16720 [Actinomycetota bacterium]|nr:MAG: hypothetical protein CM15mP49_16720 [Actinomycetota bacterium]